MHSLPSYDPPWLHQQASTTTTTDFLETSVPTLIIPNSVPSLLHLSRRHSRPPVQPWCIGQFFCPGSVLQTLNIAQLYSDPKTFVDKPTSKSAQQVLADFATFDLSTVTEGDLVNFVENDFLGEGLQLEAAELTNFNANPAFFSDVADPLLNAFARIVNGYWIQLARSTIQSALCDDYTNGACEGLLKSELYSTVNATLQSFMDEIDDFGFIPNGERTYYLDRSQPPLFVNIEFAWWANNRTTKITSPYTNQSYMSARYSINNSAPRPESYLTVSTQSEDYLTANDPAYGTPLTQQQAEALCGELASGAESGWDFTARFEMVPQFGDPGLRTYNMQNTIPVCLNSILYRAHTLLADFYGDSNSTATAAHLQTAANIRAGILDLMWDASKLAFYDFNLTSNARNSFFSAATYYPVWAGIIPDEVLSSQSNAFGYFAVVNLVMNKYNGTVPTTFVDWTGQQWDAPNTWPPHQYIILEALNALPSNLTSNILPTPGTGQSAYDLIPSGQLNLTESQLPGQPLRGAQASQNVTATGPGSDVNTLNGTVVNGGNSSSGEGWAAMLGREVANRYFTSELCSWHATGGSIPGLLLRLPNNELNLTNSVNNTGNMYEKFSILNVDSSGSGGEYTVQAGFGWTNGVLLWVAANYGQLLVAPSRPTSRYLFKEKTVQQELYDFYHCI
ncbi:glycoside hydrolase family 37 protein [Pisolithus microcarpus 441]|uniref:Trehalase n=1 Tax=Pisolithus microcarpus 441 TaxID=765257 RepID=A0A0C9XWP7_9AGAM|nr:glycoside hydrolase family 37 protein [Pisolithus microcarpus 441]